MTGGWDEATMRGIELLEDPYDRRREELPPELRENREPGGLLLRVHLHEDEGHPSPRHSWTAQLPLLLW